MSVDALIVGAGPVGLWTGMCMKASDPSLRVVAVDKYSEYKRDNPLTLQRSSFNDMPQNPKITALVEKIFTNNGEQVSTVHIQTSKIEEMFLEAAQDLGVEVRRGPEHEIQSVDALPGEFASVRIVVAADGSKSQIREKQFGKLAENNDLQHIAQVKYKTAALRPERTGKMPYMLRIKAARTPVTELPRSPKEGDTTGTMSLLIPVNSHTFSKIKDATFKTPYALEKCPKTLQNRVNFWINARQEKSDSIEVTSITLNSYKSRDFVRIDEKQGRVVGLVGDAAFGVPYFRSLNNGITCGTKFAKAAIASKSDDQTAFKRYNSFVHKLARWEMGKARAKSFAIKMFNSYIDAVGWLPQKAISAFEKYVGSAAKEYS